MAASSYGQFGAYKLALNRQNKGLQAYMPVQTTSNEVVWVTKRYCPTDERVLAPVSRHKVMPRSASELPCPEAHWIKPLDNVSPLATDRSREERLTRGGNEYFVSQPSTRCEEWSTLRQMLPSRGNYTSYRPENWGSGVGIPAARSAQVKKHFPHLNSPMTRSVIIMPYEHVLSVT